MIDIENRRKMGLKEELINNIKEKKKQEEEKTLNVNRIEKHKM